MNAFRTAMMAFLFITIFLPVPTLDAKEPGSGGGVLLLVYHGVINPVSDQYLTEGIQKATLEHDAAVVLELDTPGGLSTSMRSMVKTILGSPVPIVVYVAPEGSRAASAGLFLVYASSLAAMAPGTNIGAAHPVFLEGEKEDPTMSRKLENDAVAYVQSLAVKRGRNAPWAAQAVRKSVSIGAQEAFQSKVVEILAPDLPSLLAQAEGRTVQVGSMTKTLRFNSAVIRIFPLSAGLKVLQILSHPQIAYMLMILGFWGLVFELSQPGGIFPGVFGGVCLAIAIYGFQLFPFHWSGILLILLGLFFLLLEIKVTSYGALTAGGLLCLILGGIVLGAGNPPYFRVPVPTIVGVALVTTLFLSILIRQAWKTIHLPPVTGLESIIGQTATTLTPLDPDGEVLFQGERWRAVSDQPVEANTRVRLVRADGLTLHVQRIQ
ncbi:MAG: NfeD family protein [Leptospirales bacterium]